MRCTGPRISTGRRSGSSLPRGGRGSARRNRSPSAGRRWRRRPGGIGAEVEEIGPVLRGIPPGNDGRLLHGEVVHLAGGGEGAVADLTEEGSGRSCARCPRRRCRRARCRPCRGPCRPGRRRGRSPTGRHCGGRSGAGCGSRGRALGLDPVEVGVDQGDGAPRVLFIEEGGDSVLADESAHEDHLVVVSTSRDGAVCGGGRARRCWS